MVPTTPNRAPRKLTLLPLIGAMYFIVAGGPYGLEDIVAKTGYAGAILILLVTPLIWSLPTALMVSELTSALPLEGGYYVWVSRAMGRFWGFQEAWLSLVGSVFDMALYPALFISYLGHFAPAATAGWRGISIGIALLAASALWNLAGAKSVGVGSIAMGGLLLAPFLVFTVYACFHRAGHPVPAHGLRGADILGGVLVAMWNYMGWDNASTVAGEVERPRRTYPLAVGAALVIVALSYVLPVAAAALAGVGADRWSTGGWADVARAVFRGGAAGEAVAVAITVGGMLSAAGTLNALTLALSRLPAVLAEDGFFPRVLARWNPETGVPWVAVLSCSAAWALCLGLSFVKLVVLDVLLTGLSILLEFAALVALRLREPALARPYRIPGGLPGAIGVCVFPFALIAIAVARNRAEPVGPFNALELGGLLIIAGMAVYAGAERKRRRIKS